VRNRFGFIFSARLLFVAASALGQAAPAAPAKLAFDVATVKPSPPPDIAKIQAEVQAGRMPKFGPHVDTERAEYTFMALKDLIALAYNVKAYQITGPDWMATERFDIVAKMPDGASKDDAPAMLQGLLIERFKLSAHRDTEEHPVLALVVGKGGPKLKDSTVPAVAFDESTPLKPGEMKMDLPDGPARITINHDGTTTTNMGAKGTFTQKIDMQTQTMHLVATTLTMDGLADLLNRVMQAGGGSSRQIVNLTELKGTYQITLDLSIADLMANARAQGMNIPGPQGSGGGGVGDASDPGGGGATVSSSVQALGLKLEQRKAPVEQLVVDHVEKTPTEN
jgi:uncharacterized protein (TIGR03435 family)